MRVLGADSIDILGKKLGTILGLHSRTHPHISCPVSCPVSSPECQLNRPPDLPRPVLEGVSGRAEVPAIHAAVGPVGRGTNCGLCEFIVAVGSGWALY